MGSQVVVSGYDQYGYGIGQATREDGFCRTVRMFGSIEGELVSFDREVRSHKLKNARDALGLQIIEESDQRAAPRCPHFGSCGGCVWQHIDVQHQSQIKERSIRELFSFAPDALVSPILVPSAADGSQSWRYRNKIEFSFGQDRQGKQFIGLYDRLGRGVLDLQSCFLVPDWMERLLGVVRCWWRDEAAHMQAFRHRDGSGALRTLTLREGRSTGDRMVILTVSSRPEFAPQKTDIESFTRAALSCMSDAPAQVSVVLRIHQAIRGSPTQIYEMMLHGPDHIRETVSITVEKKKVEYTFHISPQAFFQPNTRAAELIYSKALSLAQISADDLVYDLYCGTGTFGMFAAAFAGDVVAIELSKDAAYDAKVNSERLGLSHFHIHCGDVGEVLAGLRQEGSSLQPIVIVDPPRSGLDDKALSQLLGLGPKRIVYVSCAPVNQVRDVKKIMAAGPYAIRAICPIDQFPHTPHVENIVLLEYCSP